MIVERQNGVFEFQGLFLRFGGEIRVWYLIDELADWYKRYQQAKAVDSYAEPAGSVRVGDVVDVANLPANIAFSVSRRRSAATEAPAGAGGPAESPLLGRELVGCTLCRRRDFHIHLNSLLYTSL